LPDLVKYILISLKLSDFLLVLAVTLLSVLVGFLVPRLTKLLYGPVLDSGVASVLVAMGIFMLCVRISMLIINTGSELVSGCVQTRLQVNIESAAMMRVLSLPPDFFRNYSSGELSSRMNSINSLCSAIVSAVLSSGLTSIVSLLYITQIFNYTPTLVVPSLVIIILTVGLSLITMLMDSKLALVMIATLPLIFFVVYGISRMGVPLYSQVQQSVDGMVRIVREDAQGIRVIKALSKVDYENARYDKANMTLRKKETKAGVIMGIVARN